METSLIPSIAPNVFSLKYPRLLTLLCTRSDVAPFPGPSIPTSSPPSLASHARFQSVSSHASVVIVTLGASLGGTMLACFLGSQPSSPLPLHLQERPVYLAWRAQYRISPTATVIDSEGTQLESKRFGEILLKPLDHRHMPFRFRGKAKKISRAKDTF